MSKTFKALVLDADGVFVLSSFRFGKMLIEERGFSRESMSEFWSGPFRKCMNGTLDLKEVLVPYLNEWGWDEGVDAFIDQWYEMEANIDDQMVGFLEQTAAKGIPCYMASNQEKYRAAYFRNNFPFLKYFQKVFFSSELGYTKPAITYYHLITEELKLEEKDILFWDDTPRHVEAALAYGWQAHQYTSFAPFRQAMEEYQFSGVA
ncbi:MAG: HAD-IA family hydrolase [Bacteroidota bacterium]